MTSVTVLGDRVVSGGWDNMVRIWDLETGEAQTLEGHTEAVTSVAVLGNRIVSGSLDDTVRVWNVETGEEQFLEGQLDIFQRVLEIVDFQE